MKTSSPLTIARVVGVGLAICVPALVVAQLPTFNANQVLRADQLNSLVAALNETRARVDLLQANAGVALTKDNLYEREGNSGPIATNGIARADASCDQEDVLVNCSCEGRLDGINQLSFEIRRIRASNPSNGISSCTCQAANIGSDGRSLFAIAICLDLP